MIEPSEELRALRATARKLKDELEEARGLLDVDHGPEYSAREWMKRRLAALETMGTLLDADEVVALDDDLAVPPPAPRPYVPDLVKALQGLLDDVEQNARNSFTEFPKGRRTWTDEIWERTDPETFKLAEAARSALALARGETVEEQG